MPRLLPYAAPLAIVWVAACDLDLDVHEPVVIPQGAQVVRVFADDESVQLVPASVQAGDVYLVLEGPNPAITFVSRPPGPGAELEGMDEDQARRVAEGDFQDTGIDGISVTCAADAWTEERHWTGCGENVKLTLAPGFYGVLARSDDPGVAPVMAVLEVTP